MGFLQLLLEGGGYLRTSALRIVGHLIEALAVIVILHLTEGFHGFVQIVVDEGKTVTGVLKRLPSRESETLSIVHEIHTTLKDVAAPHR